MKILLGIGWCFGILIAGSDTNMMVSAPTGLGLLALSSYYLNKLFTNK